MKIALCSTTIHTPHVLKLFKACDSCVRMFVAPDEHTPNDAFDFMKEIGVDIVQSPQWPCAGAIGMRTLARRNLAFLSALNWGAEIIVSIDDDNMPINGDYFWNIETRIFRPFNGLEVSGHSHWFDPGSLLIPNAKHRGVPHGKHAHFYSPVVGAKIGAMAGLVLGDPDIDGSTRLEHAPNIHVVSELARSGVIVAHDTHTVFNSQNSSVLRQFVPAWFLFPDCGRHDDIYASVVVKRVMRESGYHVHFGKPFAFQERNEHSTLKDIRAELDGMEHIEAFADLLDRTPLKGKSVIEDTRTIYNVLALTDWFPKRAIAAGFAWLEDCESVL